MGIATLHPILRSCYAVISRWVETLETQEIPFCGEHLCTALALDSALALALALTLALALALALDSALA